MIFLIGAPEEEKIIKYENGEIIWICLDKIQSYLKKIMTLVAYREQNMGECIKIYSIQAHETCKNQRKSQFRSQTYISAERPK